MHAASHTRSTAAPRYYLQHVCYSHVDNFYTTSRHLLTFFPPPPPAVAEAAVALSLSLQGVFFIVTARAGGGERAARSQIREPPPPMLRRSWFTNAINVSAPGWRCRRHVPSGTRKWTMWVNVRCSSCESSPDPLGRGGTLSLPVVMRAMSDVVFLTL